MIIITRSKGRKKRTIDQNGPIFHVSTHETIGISFENEKKVQMLTDR